MPEWLEPRLMHVFGDHLTDEMNALNESAPVDLRVNTIKCPDRSDLIMALDKLGYYGAPTPHSPLGVRLQKRLPVFDTQAFRDGWFEMQDEGSQIVAALVNAQAGEKVIDFCAGAGGKTLAIAAKMENRGRLLAWDVNEKRLNQIKKRLARAGVDNVILHAMDSENDQHIKRHKDSADWVLVDAPCSGSGTWRRNPHLKWRLSPADLAETVELQQRILKSAARLVKPGGRLVYATCSILPEENIEQVKTFIVDHPDFRVEPLDEMWNKHTLQSEGVGSCLQMTPYRDKTDGFFGAFIKRI
jgi:16S rRNA (cytosine967-C5)-methyltransferase